MGFDPRRWDGIRGGSARVTVGADARWAQDQPWRAGRDPGDRNGSDRNRSDRDQSVPAGSQADGWDGPGSRRRRGAAAGEAWGDAWGDAWSRWAEEPHLGAGSQREATAAEPGLAPDHPSWSGHRRNWTGEQQSWAGPDSRWAGEETRRGGTRRSWATEARGRWAGDGQRGSAAAAMGASEPEPRTARANAARGGAWSAAAGERPGPAPRNQQSARSPSREADAPAPARDRDREAPRSRVTVGAAPGITPDSVRRWGEAMAAHPRWGALRLEALSSLASHGRARGLDPTLPLEDALERRSPGLGRELRWALAGPRSRARLAVRAAFALHGPRAADRLDRRPLEVVEELLTACGCGTDADADAGPGSRRNPTGSGSHSQGRPGSRHGRGQEGSGSQGGSGGSGADQRRSNGGDHAGTAGQSTGQSKGQAKDKPPIDPRRREALMLLGLEPDASPAAVKAAHRRLVKRHHPDMGGDAESFRRVDAAYRLLIA